MRNFVLVGVTLVGLIGVPGTVSAQDQATATTMAVMEPTSAFDEKIQDTFIQNEFVVATVADGYPRNAVLGFADEGCPDGWDQLVDDDEEKTPLFYAFGLLVDREGNHRTGYVRIPACIKQ